MSGFFNDLKALLKFRVPSSIEPSPIPPTPIAEAIKDLLLSPLSLTNSPDARYIISFLFKHGYIELVAYVMKNVLHF